MGRPIVLDLTAVRLSPGAIAHLIAELSQRAIRIIGIEGAEPADLGPDLPPLLKDGRPAGVETSDYPNPRRNRSQRRCCWKSRCAPASR